LTKYVRVSNRNWGVIKFIREFAPDFCWVTSFDLYLMAEIEFPDLDQNSFEVSLSGLVKSGLFHVKPYNHGSRKLLYLRVSDPLAIFRG